MTGVGIVGTGFMATVHSRAARQAGATLCGIVGSSPQRSAAAADALGIRRGYATLDALLDEPAVDVVHVCTPNALHAGQVEAVLAAGKHVICEKPLATASADADALARAAAAAGRVATVPFVYRFHPLVREARARIADGRLGPVLTIRGAYVQDWMLDAGSSNWRIDPVLGGPSRAFADIGSHLVDLVEFVTGDRIVALAAATGTFVDRPRHRGTEDAAVLTIRTAAGAIGTATVSQVTAGRKNSLTLEIGGEAGSIAFDGERPEQLWLGGVASSTVLPRDPAHLDPRAARLCRVPAGHPQGYQDAFNAFVADTYAAIDGAAPDGLPTFDDGARAALLTDTVLAAAREERWLTVPSATPARAARQPAAAHPASGV